MVDEQLAARLVAQARERGSARSARTLLLHPLLRQRYGTTLCPAERLPADRLEAAVVKAMLETYQRTDPFEQAVAQAHASAATNLEQFTSELATVQVNRRRTEELIVQYLRSSRYRR